jgi:fructose-1,6-bisphosphatase I
MLAFLLVLSLVSFLRYVSVFNLIKKPGSKGSVADVLRPGSDMVAAGYAMYGSSTTLVLTTGNGVNGYTLDPSLGEFILTHPNVIPFSSFLT